MSQAAEPNHLLERDEPRAQLEAALAAARSGHGAILSLEGEAGIGKTTLALEFAEAHRRDAGVYIGGCEHLTTPEPLGPLRDIARESEGRFSIPTTGLLATFEALLRFLARGRGPALLVIEDLHWADDATLDLIRFLARRVRKAPVLVLVTCRTDEAASQAQLTSLWTEMPRDAYIRLALQPLSLVGVASLAKRANRSPREVFAATGGIPFHVTEYLAVGAGEVPRSVAEATLARTAALSPQGRTVLQCAAIFPRQVEEVVLQRLASDHDHAGVEECLRVGMLHAHGETLAFRHELARRAVLESLSPLKRRQLHAAALEVLQGRGRARAAEFAHHAEQARAWPQLMAYSILAAEEAARLGAHREAVAHLARALEHGMTLPDAERARLLELQAESGERCGAFHIATSAINAAIAIRRRVGDALELGNALRIAGRLLWQQGQADAADERAREAVATLSAHPESWQYAMALSAQSQLDMLSDRIAEAITRGGEAMRLAELLGRDDIAFHALTNVGAAETCIDVDAGLSRLAGAIDQARTRGQLETLPRLYNCLTFLMASNRRYEELFDRIDEGIAAAVRHDNVPAEGYLRGVRAIALLDQGRLHEALAEAEGVTFGCYPQGAAEIPALVTLSRTRVRLGLPELGLLAIARTLNIAHSDELRAVPIAVAEAEAAWLGEDKPHALANLRRAFEGAERTLSAGSRAESALWLAILGEPPHLSSDTVARISEPYRLHIAGRWRDAAAAWEALGCPYEQAIALSGGDAEAQRTALTIFHRLGAAPAARRLRQAMRANGLRSIPVGPRSPRRAHPAGLTPRQDQVLQLLAEGLSNLEIAERLGASAKTVEHHVSAVLAALDAPSRLRAVQVARERGLLTGS